MQGAGDHAFRQNVREMFPERSVHRFLNVAKLVVCCPPPLSPVTHPQAFVNPLRESSQFEAPGIFSQLFTSCLVPQPLASNAYFCGGAVPAAATAVVATYRCRQVQGKSQQLQQDKGEKNVAKLELAPRAA